MRACSLFLRLRRLALLTLCWVPAAFGADPAPAESTQLMQKTGELFRAIPVSMQIKRPPPAEVDPKLRARAQQLRLEVQRTLDDGLPTRLENTPLQHWSSAAKYSYRCSLILEYTTFAEAETALKSWWTALAAQPTPGEPVTGLRLPLELANDAIRTWLDAESQACARLIDEIERTFQPLQRPELRSPWLWNLPTYQQVLRAVARELPAAQRQALENEMEKDVQTYLRDETIPLEQRTRSVTLFANQHYSRVEVSQAVALLDQWAERYPVVWNDFHWLRERYYLAAIGEGDFRKAAVCFHRIEAVTESAAIDQQSEVFIAVAQSYYWKLSQPFLVNAATAARVRRQRLAQISIPKTP